MPLSFFSRRREEDRIRAKMESYKGWSVVSEDGRKLGKVADIEYKTERNSNGKIKVTVTNVKVDRDGRLVDYNLKEVREEDRVIVVKPKKDELMATVDEIRARLEETVSKLRKVNEMLIKLGDVMLSMISNNEKIPQDLIEKFRKMLEDERVRYLKDCDEKLEKLSKIIAGLDARITEMESEYGELKLKSELGQLDGDDKAKLSEVKENLDRLRSIRNDITMLVYKYKSECI